MAKQPKTKTDNDEAASMEQLDAALKKMLTTPHETNKEMVERRRRQGMRSNQRPAKRGK
jgi:hypothetical protein